MKEHRYTMSKREVWGSSLLLGLFVSITLFLNIYMIWHGLDLKTVPALIVANGFFGTTSFFGVKIWADYVRHSSGKEFILTYDSVRLVDRLTKQQTEIRNTDIKSIELHIAQNSKFPWMSYSYIRFVGQNDAHIVVPCFMLDLADLWRDTLSRKIDSKKLTRIEHFYPKIID